MTARVARAVCLVPAAVLVVLFAGAATAATPRTDLSRYFSAEEMHRAHAYRTSRDALALSARALRVALMAAVLFLSSRMTRWARAAGDRFGRSAAARDAASALVAAAVIEAVFEIAEVGPAAAIYRLDRAHGLVHQGAASWLADRLAARGIELLVLAPCAFLVLVLARRMRHYGFPAGAAAAALLAAGVTLWPLAVEPLFNRFTPLPPGEVRTAAVRVIERAGLEVGDLLVMDASRRSSRVNAYVSGMGRTQRVVLYDTLVRDVPAREVAVVLAHEVAHRSRRHLLVGTALACAGCIAAFPAASWILARVGWPGGRPQGPGFIAALAFVLLLFAAASEPLSNAVSRRMEAEADAVARELVDDRSAALDVRLRLARLNLADPSPPSWVKVLLYDHPTLPERIAAAELDIGIQPGVNK